MKRNYAEIMLIVFICLLLVFFTLMVVDTAKAQQTSSTSQGWQAPKIEACDMELWDRIRRLCNADD
jgi:hypothetical protein